MGAGPSATRTARSHSAPASPAPLSQALPRLPRRNKPILRGDETGFLSAIFDPAGPGAGADGLEAEEGGDAPVAALPARGQRQPESRERSMGQKRRARPAGPGSRAGRDGFVLSIVCAATEGKEGGGGGAGLERCWQPPAGPGGAADSPLFQGAPRVKLRCQLNIPAAAAALRGGRGTGTGVPSLQTLPELLRVPRRAGERIRARAWRGQRGARSAAGAEAAERRAGARPAVTYKGSSPEECISCG